MRPRFTSTPRATRPGRSSFQEAAIITLGVILLLIGYLAPIPLAATIGWILLAVGLVLLVLGAVGRPVGGRGFWY